MFRFSVLAAICVLALPGPPCLAQQSEADPPARHGEPWIKKNVERGVDWQGLTRSGLLFLAVEHGFRIATEPGTREGLKQPFFSGYAASLSSLRGWSDGDPFMVNYVGHPM